MLHDAIFLATHLVMLKNEIHCKLQVTCYTLHVTRYNLRMQLTRVSKNYCNRCKKVELSSTAKHIAGGLQHVTCPLCNLSRNVFGLATTAQSRARFYFLHRLHGICFVTIASYSSRLQCVV